MTKLNKIVRGGEYHPTFVVPTPSQQVNSYLQDGGIPSNSFIQIQGKNESSFKTTLSLEILRNAQEQGLEVGFVDAELAMNFDWARGLGIDTDKWFYAQPTSGENAWQMCYDMISEHGCKVVILDSLDAATPSVLVDSELGDAAIGSAARLHSKAIRKALPILAEHDAIIIAINHKKVNITQMGARGYNAGGGKAIGFYSKLILELSTGTANSKKGDDVIDLNIFIEKNKLGKSYITIKEKVEQGKGIVEEYILFDELRSKNIITKSGTWFRIKGQDDPIAQGETNAVEWVKQNKDYVKELLS